MASNMKIGISAALSLSIITTHIFLPFSLIIFRKQLSQTLSLAFLKLDVLLAEKFDNTLFTSWSACSDTQILLGTGSGIGWSFIGFPFEKLMQHLTLCHRVCAVCLH